MNGKAYARAIYESIQPNLITPKKLMDDPIFGESAKKMFSVSNIERELETLKIVKPDSPRFSPKIDYVKVEK